jgi:hypothetical protein
MSLSCVVDANAHPLPADSGSFLLELNEGEEGNGVLVTGNHLTIRANPPRV